MLTILAISTGTLAALLLLWHGSDRNLTRFSADTRGIALQTVIVIVVMLVIAGGVSGVLLSRGAEVTADLAEQEIGAINEQWCVNAGLNGLGVTGVWTLGTTCTLNSGVFSQLDCSLLGNQRQVAVYSPLSGATPQSCVITVS